MEDPKTDLQTFLDDYFTVDNIRIDSDPVLIDCTENTVTFADVNPDTISRSSGSWVDDEFDVGDTLIVSGSTSNNGTYTIDVVTALTLTLVAGDSLEAETNTTNTITFVGEDTPITEIPQVERYATNAETYIKLINQGPPRYSNYGDNENIAITLVTDFVINQIGTRTDEELESIVQQIIDEIKTDSNTWNSLPARTFDLGFHPQLNFSVGVWIIAMTFEFKYWAVAR